MRAIREKEKTCTSYTNPQILKNPSYPADTHIVREETIGISVEPGVGKAFPDISARSKVGLRLRTYHLHSATRDITGSKRSKIHSIVEQQRRRCKQTRCPIASRTNENYRGDELEVCPMTTAAFGQYDRLTSPLVNPFPTTPSRGQRPPGFLSARQGSARTLRHPSLPRFRPWGPSPPPPALW